MYGSNSYEYTDVLVAREMEKDYFGPYLVTELFRYDLFWGSNRLQRESKNQGFYLFSWLFLCTNSWGILSHQKSDNFFIFVDWVQPLKPIYMPKMAVLGLF